LLLCIRMILEVEKIKNVLFLMIYVASKKIAKIEMQWH
jgi:hypothetical protein